MDSCEILFLYCEFANQPNAGDQNIVEHRRVSVVSMTFTKNKKKVNYFVWWIIWHFVRTDISLNLSKLT